MVDNFNLCHYNNNKNLITPKGYYNEIKNYVKNLQDINPVAFLSNSFQLD